jgi:pheromone a factor receptor
MPVSLPIASFICAALVLVPLPWHWRAGTVPTLSIAFWLFIDNFINGVNTILWADSVETKALIWCDISASPDSNRSSVSDSHLRYKAVHGK